LVPGKDFDASKLRADFAKRIPEIAFDRIMLQFKINKDVKDVNGWGYTTKTGIYGTDYLMRARRGPITNRIGFPRPTASSFSCCACTGRTKPRPRSSTGRGQSRR